MQFVRSLFAPSRRAPVRSAPGAPETIDVPYLGDMNTIRQVPVPGSGYDRANWFAADMDFRGPESRTRAVFANAGHVNIIGSNERGVNGSLTFSDYNDDYYTGYIEVAYPDERTRQSDDLGPFWGTQTSSSKGLNVPGNDQVYVGEDTQSVWT